MTAVDTATRDVVAELRRRGIGDLDDSTLTRALYSTDASLYRVVPQVVVRPRSVDEVLATIEACRTTGTPLTSRGAGTSIAGNAVGTGVVLDFSRHLNRVHEIDAEARTATVDPGTVHAVLQKAAMARGLRFGPDPSTHTRCTVGGMIGNNACGSRALAYGRTSDNVVRLDAVTMAGERLSLGGEQAASSTLDQLKSIVADELAVIRTEFGTFGRQVSGYSLEHLLPENGFDVATFMAGTEGTLATLTSATVRLVEDPSHRLMLVLGYGSMAEAADDVPAILEFSPTACEGLDSRIVNVVRDHGGTVPELPRGQGWLFVEISGADAGEIADTVRKAAAAASAVDSRIVTDPREQAVLWRIREEGAGLATRTLPRKALSGWEDAAVPPERLGTYLREQDVLLAEYGLDGVPYGHFGDGCVHIRIDFPLDDPGGHDLFRGFLVEAATLVSSLGGSLSGEHGDGRARSELLPLMYSDTAIGLFGKVKSVFDPDDLLNPGVLVRPSALDADLRGPESMHARLGLRLLHDEGDFGKAVHRCTGVGKCLADNSSSHGVMCPSFQATRNEKDSTRGRARVLQEMVDGRLVTGGWRSPEVHEALDLCLSCKGCTSDCPTGTDMATYKSEVLHQAYKGRLRPRSHYLLGQLPRWARLTSPFALLANLALRTPGVRSVIRWAAGVDQRRSLPMFARGSFRRWAGKRPVAPRDDRPPVLIWVDSFTDYFTTAGGKAALSVLESAGYRVEVLGRRACCGLTWITTGQLDHARELIAETVATLHPYVAAGTPIVGLEPSCLAVLRSDAVELTDDPRAVEVAGGVFTLAELLQRTPGWAAPDLTGTHVVVQPHCHQASVMGFDADMALLESTGATIQRLSGCCGLAGNFGVEKGHHEVSVAVAELQLLPALRNARADTIVLADGFSCRTQLKDLADHSALHLAQLLDH
ncbi:FAD-binding and (Fe-S)-binding domain-containing protein [Aeromicrobium panaciterrae]|uniref:FAD-binding and (Fe-S)-binding domain-containing protein n=1 Tax=Aeromicrobium panaciterrae TaxID=363861 RepID=UPI0031CE2ECC